MCVCLCEVGRDVEERERGFTSLMSFLYLCPSFCCQTDLMSFLFTMCVKCTKGM